MSGGPYHVTSFCIISLIKTRTVVVTLLYLSNGNIFRVTCPLYGEFTRPPHKGQWRGVLMFSLICTWINRWVNTREAGDLRRHRAHFEVIVMKFGHKHNYRLTKCQISMLLLQFISLDITSSQVEADINCIFERGEYTGMCDCSF